MEDLGPPTSWLTLEPGRPVYSCDGKKLGKVERVIGDTREDIFEGLVITRGILSGAARLVDAEQIEQLFERGVLLKLDAAAAEQLPEAR